MCCLFFFPLYMSIIPIQKPGMESSQIPKYSKKDGIVLTIKESNQTYKLWKVLHIIIFAGSFNKEETSAKYENYWK